MSALVRAAIVGGVRDEDRALGARRVVLGQARDLVEQLAAAVVVEPLRRQGLRRRREPGADIRLERAREIVGPEVDVDPHSDVNRTASGADAVSSTSESSGISCQSASSSGSDTMVDGRAKQGVPETGAVECSAVGEQQVELGFGLGRDLAHDGRERGGGGGAAVEALEHEGEQHLGVGVTDDGCRRAGSISRQLHRCLRESPLTYPLSENSQPSPRTERCRLGWKACRRATRGVPRPRTHRSRRRQYGECRSSHIGVRRAVVAFVDAVGAEPPDAPPVLVHTRPG